MKVMYLRSSSYNNFDFCQMQYYLGYVLGIPQTSNKKADKGTIVHKAMEIMALCKYDIQNECNGYIMDDSLGQIEYKVSDILDRNDDFLIDIVDKSYNYYSSKYNHHDWEKLDLKHCKQWSLDAVSYQDGAFDPRVRNIFSTEQKFDFCVDRDWAKYSYDINGEIIEGNLGLKGTIDLITRINDNVIEVIDWKGFPLDTKIPTISGWSTIGELVVGDVIFDKDGKETKVIAKSQQTYKDCYKITFDDTTEAICDYEHLWLLDDGSVVDTPNLKIGSKIEVTKPIICNNTQLPIDPYILGLWLGDGRNRNGEITSGDKFIFDEIVNRGYKIGENLDDRNPNQESKTVYGLRTKLRKLNLLHNKHIPQQYLRSSYEQRLDLLRGLMDSDGNANPTRKQAVFTTCNKQLSDDVKELLLSLGQRVNQGDITRDTSFKENVQIYPLHFRPININPFLLPRKADQIDSNWGPGLSNKRRITNIEKLSTQLKTQCIKVDSESSTFLCTENFIPTHNTGQRKDWSTGKQKDLHYLQTKDFQLMFYYYALKHLYPEKEILLTIFFIRDGGPFTVTYSDSDLVGIERKIKSRFNQIKHCVRPKMVHPRQKDFKCTKLCHFYKNNWPGTKKNICQYVSDKIDTVGIDETTRTCIDSNHRIDKYNAPGE